MSCDSKSKSNDLTALLQRQQHSVLEVAMSWITDLGRVSHPSLGLSLWAPTSCLLPRAWLPLSHGSNREAPAHQPVSHPSSPSVCGGGRVGWSWGGLACDCPESWPQNASSSTM